jgi:hypothetical protein
MENIFALAFICFKILTIIQLFQVWSARYNKEGNRILSLSDDKNMIIYSIPV